MDAIPTENDLILSRKRYLLRKNFVRTKRGLSGFARGGGPDFLIRNVRFVKVFDLAPIMHAIGTMSVLSLRGACEVCMSVFTLIIPECTIFHDMMRKR